MTLSLIHAQREVGASDEEAELFMAAVLGEMDRSPWPKGFF